MPIQPDFCRRYAWHGEIASDDLVDVPTTMLSETEKAMLHWLAKNMVLSEGGCIVDLGCFLGGSTLSLATGLEKNPESNIKDYRIHTYDIFLAPNDDYSLRLIGNLKRPGDTVLDIFARNLGRHSSSVVVHSGDFIEAMPPRRPIEILFIDIAKTRQLNAKIIMDFFPLLVPGKSIIVQQDHNDHSCPWVNASMHKLMKYVDVLCDDSSSRVYYYKEAIPEDVLREAAFMSLDEEYDLLQDLAENHGGKFSRFFTAISAAWTVLERDGADVAISYIKDIDQPWESAVPYSDMVENAIKWVGTPEGLQRFHENYFSAAR